LEAKCISGRLANQNDTYASRILADE